MTLQCQTTPCPNANFMAEHACTNAAQCWEPCGELGKCDKSAAPSHRPDLTLPVTVLLAARFEADQT